MYKAKKKFGQNFLKDSTILNKIIKAIPNNVKFDNQIVEIGPGLGDLTFWLLKSNFCVTSYEIDDELVPILQTKFKSSVENGNFKLINTDANLVWQSGSLLNRPYFLVANLPYYVATKMLLNALKDELCLGVVAMVQREVALKFACKGEDSEFSSLGVLANLNGSCELLFDVAKECFNPEPKVVSSVLKIEKTSQLFESGLFKDLKEYVEFQEFLKAYFIAPRKTLMKNLSSKFDKELLNLVFKELEISSNLRPHQSNITLCLEIYQKVKNEQRKSSNRR